MRAFIINILKISDTFPFLQNKFVNGKDLRGDRNNPDEALRLKYTVTSTSRGDTFMQGCMLSLLILLFLNSLSKRRFSATPHIAENPVLLSVISTGKFTLKDSSRLQSSGC